MVTNHLTSSLGDSHHAGHHGQLTELDDVILTVFEEVEDTFSFPVQSQKDARAFVRAVHGRGITYETLSEEIGEHLQILTSWRKSLGRQGIGEKVMKRINKPMNDLLEEPDYVWADRNPTPKQTAEQNGNHVEAKCEVNATNGNANEDNVKETVIADAAIEEIHTQEPKTMESFINNLTETIINEVTGRTSPPTSGVEKTSSAVSSTKKISPPVSRRSSNSSEEEQEKETVSTKAWEENMYDYVITALNLISKHLVNNQLFTTVFFALQMYAIKGECSIFKKKITLWMKTIYYPNTIRSHLVTIVPMAPFTPKSTSKLRSALHIRYSIVIPRFISRANTPQS